jgi:glycyl-tRNA synthetase
MNLQKLRFREHEKEKLSHYSKATTDVEYDFPFGWGELEGIANRTDYDLRQHQIGMRSLGKWKGEDLQDFQLAAEDAEYSSGKLSYFDDAEKRRYIPFVIEPSAGADRATLAFLVDAYDEDVAQNETRVVLRLHPKLAPIKAAVLPLVKKDGMPERADKIYQELRKRWPVAYDEAAAIGRRYRRMDEVGTPVCITIDGEAGVTVRERDSMKQERISEDQVAPYLDNLLNR